MIRVDGITGEISLLVDEAVLAQRHPEQPDLSASHVGMGRELFTLLRENITGAEQVQAQSLTVRLSCINAVRCQVRFKHR